MDFSLIISTITAVVQLFDLAADQVERFLSKKEESAVPKDHRMKIQREDNSLVVINNNQVTKRITATDLEKLPPEILQHINVLEQSMKNHYLIWADVYPELALQTDPIAKSRIEQQLKKIIHNMKNDLEGILTFLEQCGIQLDDHYQHIRNLIHQV